MSFDLDKIVHNAKHGNGPCHGCPAQTDTKGQFVNPGLINPDAEIMFLTMDPSHYIDWDEYDDWSEYNKEKSNLFMNHWPGGKAIRQLLSRIPTVSLNEIWLADAVKCPVNNERAGNVNKDEAFRHCSAYLKEEIHHVNPSVIVTMGNDPAEQLLNGVFNRNVGEIRAGSRHCGQIINTEPPVVISPHWAHGWLNRNNNREKVQNSILDVLDIS